MAVEGEKGMDENKTSEYLLVVMKNLNLIIILFISMLITYSLSGTVKEGSALRFRSRPGRSRLSRLDCMGA